MVSDLVQRPKKTCARNASDAAFVIAVDALCCCISALSLEYAGDEFFDRRCSFVVSTRPRILPHKASPLQNPRGGYSGAGGDVSLTSRFRDYEAEFLLYARSGDIVSTSRSIAPQNRQCHGSRSSSFTNLSGQRPGRPPTVIAFRLTSAGEQRCPGVTSD
jgi:hypothetical protein